MKVLILSPVYSERGGGALTVRKLATNIARSGAHVLVVTTEKERDRFVPEGVEVRFLTNKILFGTEYISPLEIRSIIKEFRPDIVHGSGPSIISDMGFVISRLLHIPMVMTYHADLNLEKPLSRIYTATSTALVLRNMEGVCVTTQRYAQVLEERGIAKEKISIVPLGCDCSRFDHVKRPGKGERTVLFVGGLGPRSAYKRADLLIRAFAIVKRSVGDARLRLIGSGEFVPKYEELARSLDLDASFDILTDVDDGALPKYYNEASVFVLPSPDDQEGFGIVLLEAMASGTPVITSEACGGAPAVWESGSGLLYVPYDIDDLALKIVKLLTDKDLAKQLGDNGLRLAASYDWAKSAEAQMKAYEKARSR